MKDNHDEDLYQDYQDDFTPLTFDDDAIKKFDPQRYSLFVTSGRFIDPVFEEKFTVNEL